MLKLVFALEALVDVGFGVALLLGPAVLLSIYGMETDRDGTFLGRFLGATLVGFGAICWFARDWPDSDHRRLLIRALFLTTSLGFAVCLLYQLQPGAPLPAVVFVVLTGGFTFAWGYFAVADRARSRSERT